MGNFNKINQSQRKKELDERRLLEEKMSEFPDILENLTDEAKRLLRKKENAKLDYEKVKEEIDIESTSIIETSASFYFDKQEIENEPYLIEKLKIFKITISNLLFQMKTAEHAIIKLLEKIDEGAGVDRSFEVLASLQRSKMEIVKHLSSFMIVMENNLKNLRNDYLSKKNEGRVVQKLTQSEDYISIEEGEEIGSLRTRGTKDLIKSLQFVSEKINKEKYGESLDFEES